jgi:tetratricopeptide (TPR) repeat protein
MASRKRPKAIAPPAVHSPWRIHLWRVLAICAVAFAAYSNSLHTGMVFDNAKIILEDPRVHEASWANLRLILGGEYWPNLSTSGLYRPLTSLSYMFNYAVLGNAADPEGYHWINLLLDGANLCLVYALGVMILRSPAQAMSLAILWGVHPLLTESVANIVGRADLLAAFGVLAGVLCYARFLSAGGGKRWGWLAALAAAQAIGLLSKESAIVLPAILLLFDFAWPERATIRRRAPAYAALLLLAGMFFYIRHRLQLHMAASFLENPLTRADFWTARLTALKVAGNYVATFVWPGRLSADYSYNAIPLFGWRLNRWEDAKAIVSLAGFVAAMVLCWKIRRTHRPLLFFAGLFFVALLPASNLVVVIGSIMAERFMYLPAVGLTGCVVYGACLLIPRIAILKWLPADRVLFAAATLVALALAVRTYSRNPDWQDDVSLWSSAVEAYPQNARAHYNLGTALLKTGGQTPDAIAEFESAVRIAPDDFWEAHYNLGNVLVRSEGRLPDAIREYRAAVRIKPDVAEAHTNLGLALEKNGEFADAATELQIALRYQPDDAKAHYDLGNLFFRMPGRTADAIHEWENAAKIDPGFAEAHYNLGIVFFARPGHLPEAIAQLEETVKIRPAYADARYKLARALLQVSGREAEAVEQFDAAMQISPNAAEQEKFNSLRSGLAHRAGVR